MSTTFHCEEGRFYKSNGLLGQDFTNLLYIYLPDGTADKQEDEDNLKKDRTQQYIKSKADLLQIKKKI
jgi:hypothetical protein